MWTPERQKAFEKFKAILLSDVVLTYPQTDSGYKLYTDAPDYAIGAILVQEDVRIEGVVLYLSLMIDDVKRRWPTIEKEAYTLVYALQKPRPNQVRLTQR